MFEAGTLSVEFPTEFLNQRQEPSRKSENRFRMNERESYFQRSLDL